MQRCRFQRQEQRNELFQRPAHEDVGKWSVVEVTLGADHRPRPCRHESLKGSQFSNLG